MSHRRLALLVALLCCLPLNALRAQSATIPEDIVLIGPGWAALGAGQLSEAAGIGLQTLARYPRSVPAGTLLVVAETMRLGSTAGLAAYERWLGTSKLEDPYMLRPVAVGLLREIAQTGSTEAKLAALRALADDGDVATLTELGQRATAGGLVEVEVLAARGSEPAVKSLIASLQVMQGNKGRLISALVSTRSPLVVPPLKDLLKDPNPDNREAAADALGRLGAADAISALKPLLNDPLYSVQFKTARALFRLRDYSGQSLLQRAQNSETPYLRAEGLEAVSSEPTPGWIDAVRRLLSEGDPQARLLGARLIAPHDPAAAAAAFQGLMTDGNMAVRETASQTYVASIVTDVASIRFYFRSADVMTRVKAANRLLELTR